MIVTLDTAEILHGAMIGIARRVSSLKRGGRPRYDTPSVDRWTAEVEGACAELAVSKLTGLFWNALTSHPSSSPDCGPFYVRWTERADRRLIIRPNDPDAPFVLVTGRAPTYDVRGVIMASEARVERFWIDDAHWIPASELTPIEEYVA